MPKRATQPLEVSGYNEVSDEIDQSQPFYSSLYECNTDQYSEWFTLHIKTDSALPSMQKRAKKRSLLPEGTAKAIASHVFSEKALIRVQVKGSFSVWATKTVMFGHLKGAEGFDPPAVSLYLYPNIDDELSNLLALDSLGISSKSLIIAVPSVTQHTIKNRSAVSKKLNSSRSDPRFTFAIGRGLTHGAIDRSCIFTIYHVNKGERYAQNCEDKFNVVFQLTRDNSAQNQSAIPPSVEYNNLPIGKTIVDFIPHTPGNYLIHVTVKKNPIVLSPFEFVAIKPEHTPSGIRELAFTGWDVEAASILAQLASKPDQHEFIFGIGMSTLMHLLHSPDRDIQTHINQVFENLLLIQENHIRIATGGSIQLIHKIIRNPAWTNHGAICKFIGRVLSFALETNSSFRKHFLTSIGVEPLLSLAYSDSIESMRFAVKSLFVISVHTDNIEALLHHGLFMEAIIHLLAEEDILVKRYCLHTLYNLTKSNHFNELVTQRKLSFLIKQLQTEDRRLQLDVLMILSQIKNPLLAQAFIESHIGEVIYKCIIVDSFLLAWEAKDLEMETEDFLKESLLFSETKIQSDLNTVTLRFINNVLSLAAKDQLLLITKSILETQGGQIMRDICKLAGSIEIRIQREACNIISSLVSSSPQLGKQIIEEEGLLWLFGCFYRLDLPRQKYLFGAVERFSYHFYEEFTFPDDDLIPIFVKYAESKDKYLSERCLTILAHVCRNPFYKSLILDLYHDLLDPLLRVIRSKGLFIQSKEVTWEQIQVPISHLDANSRPRYDHFPCKYGKKEYSVHTFDEKKEKEKEKESLNDFANNIAFLHLLPPHKNIASSQASCTSPPLYFSLTDCYASGNLENWVKNTPELSFQDIIPVMLDILCGVQCLHSKNVIHRNIQPKNIFIYGNNNRAVLSGFHKARLCSARMTPSVGSAAYIAPEAIDSTEYTAKVDIYSIGVVFWFLMERSIPFPSLSFMDILQLTCEGKRPKMTYDTPIGSLIHAIWHNDPDERPLLVEIQQELHSLQQLQDFLLPEPEKSMVSPGKKSQGISNVPLLEIKKEGKPKRSKGFFHFPTRNHRSKSTSDRDEVKISSANSPRARTKSTSTASPRIRDSYTKKKPKKKKRHSFLKK